MTISTWAVLDGANNIINIILWDGVTEIGLDSAAYTTVISPAADGSIAEIGGVWNGTAFVPPLS